MIKRFFTVVFVLCFLAATPHIVGAYGGGLNRDGCHRETATGGYHCHRKGGDVNWETIGIVAGGLLVMGLAFSAFTRHRNPLVFPGIMPEKGLRFTPARGDQIGAFLELRF